MTTAESLFTRFSELLSNPRGGEAQEYQWTGEELKKCIAGIYEDVVAMEEAVAVAKANPARFNVRYLCCARVGVLCCGSVALELFCYVGVCEWLCIGVCPSVHSTY